MSGPDSRAKPSAQGRFLLASGVAALLCLAVLTGFACFVLYRVGRAVDSLAATTARLGDRVDGIGAQVERAAGSAAEVSECAKKLAGRVNRLSERLELADEWAEAMGTSGGQLAGGEEKLIDGLLGAIRRSGLTFVRGGKEKSALRMWAWLYAKYRTWKPGIGSAEDFVKKVATETLGGDPYEVVGKDGKRRPLAGWLTERLAGLRAGARKKKAAASPESAPPGKLPGAGGDG